MLTECNQRPAHVGGDDCSSRSIARDSCHIDHRRLFEVSSEYQERQSDLTVNEWNARTFGMGSRDNGEIAFHELCTTNLEAFLDNFGSELVNTIVVGVVEDMVNNAALVGRRTMFTQVLDAPVAELTMGDEIDVSNDFLNRRALERMPG